IRLIIAALLREYALMRWWCYLGALLCVWAGACDSKESVSTTQPASGPGVTEATTQPALAYAGSASCMECHQEAFDEWKTSHHALAQRDLDPALDDPAFKPGHLIAHGT